MNEKNFMGSKKICFITQKMFKRLFSFVSSLNEIFKQFQIIQGNRNIFRPMSDEKTIVYVNVLQKIGLTSWIHL